MFQSVPILFALMQKKTKMAYNLIIEHLKSLAPTLKPTSIITDFESALRDSLVENFPEAISHGCWFHHNQVCWFIQLILNIIYYSIIDYNYYIVRK